MAFAAIGLAAVWALAEAVVFFIVADVPIMAVALRWGWRQGVMAACFAAVFAALGGAVVYMGAATLPELTRPLLLGVPGISAQMLDDAVESYGMGGFLPMLAGSFTGVPYKLYAFAAGLNMVPLPAFLLQSVFARLPRFLLVALLSGWLGERLRPSLPQWAIWALFGVCWLAFYAWYFTSFGW